MQTPDSSTRTQLILAALKLFAQEGINAVSLRAINQAAGARNSGAVHYYFENKQGLLEEVVRYILDEVVKLRGCQLDDMLSNPNTPNVQLVLLAFYQPYWQLQLRPEIGTSAARLMMQLHLDPNPGVQQLFVQHEAESWQKLELLLRRALPEKNPEWLRLHIGMSWINVLVGLTSLELRQTTPLGAMGFEDPVELINASTAFLAAGVSSAA